MASERARTSTPPHRSRRRPEGDEKRRRQHADKRAGRRRTRARVAPSSAPLLVADVQKTRALASTNFCPLVDVAACADKALDAFALAPFVCYRRRRRRRTQTARGKLCARARVQRRRPRRSSSRESRYPKTRRPLQPPVPSIGWSLALAALTRSRRSCASAHAHTQARARFVAPHRLESAAY